MKEENKLLTFDRAGFMEWQEMWATGRRGNRRCRFKPYYKIRLSVEGGVGQPERAVTAAQKMERSVLNICRWELIY